jgi:hypothetical protein
MDPASLQLDYIASDRLAGLPASWWAGVLGIVGFETSPNVDAVHVPVTASMTPSLGRADGLCEVWRVDLGTASKQRGRVHYRCCDELLFGSVIIDEEGLGDGAVALRRATTLAYQDIFAVLEETRHRHLIRVWNYLPEINRETDGDERYRHFNSARQTAFRDSDRSTGRYRSGGERFGIANRQSGLDLLLGGTCSADHDRESASNERLSLSPEVRRAQSGVLPRLRAA